MIYETKDGFYKKTYKYHIVIGILVSVIVLLGVVLMGTSISATRQHRIELERSTQLEQTVRSQEQRIRESSEQLRVQSECIRRTSSELGDIIQSSNGRIEASITSVQELRKTMQALEVDYNDMRNRISDLYDNISNFDNTEEKIKWESQEQVYQ